MRSNDDHAIEFPETLRRFDGQRQHRRQRQLLRHVVQQLQLLHHQLDERLPAHEFLLAAELVRLERHCEAALLVCGVGLHGVGQLALQDAHRARDLRVHHGSVSILPAEPAAVEEISPRHHLFEQLFF